ncbi:MAG: exo-alpha-sialidase [Spirochaetaceae bacterium]|nr:MAG: exo-alpha-sialidase [Spirochaetaceae bacterium]
MNGEHPGSGHWFGGGNIVKGPDGALYLVGRYRNFGDSRTGLGKGERGKELAIFRSEDEGGSFRKILSFSKERLDTTAGKVLSIEASHLLFHDGGVTLYLSTEKDLAYPADVADYHKPGTGVWSIDRMDAPSVEQLMDATVQPFIASADPEHLHVKDPFACVLDGQTYVGYCTHPFTWASSNAAFYLDGNRGANADNRTEAAPAQAARWEDQILNVFPRGPAWDVAMARMTCYAPVPAVGRLAGGPEKILAFYDGAECVRQLDEHPTAVKRPRGYSCEEIGGLAVADASAPLSPARISTRTAEFVSPWGTGCSRYVDVLFTERWAFASWQQSQEDQSQPLVMNRVSIEKVAAILA